MAFSSSEVDRLLAAGPARLPLRQAEFRAVRDVCRFRPQEAATLFPGARQAQAAFAGLLLRAGCWAESHAIAQDLSSAEGSYWHAILHRLEPDTFNAGYWFRRVGQHAIFPELWHRTVEIVKTSGPKHWHLKTAWDPFLFLEWCDEGRDQGGPAEATARDIQMVEWQLLFDWCTTTDSSGLRDRH